jgi:hypothetical protein
VQCGLCTMPWSGTPSSECGSFLQAVALARDLLAHLSRSAADAFTVIFGDRAAAEAAGSSGGLSNPVVAVDPSAGNQLAGPLLVVGATQQQAIGGSAHTQNVHAMVDEDVAGAAMVALCLVAYRMPAHHR